MKIITLNIISPAERKPAGIGSSAGSVLLSVLSSFRIFTSKILTNDDSLCSSFSLSLLLVGIIFTSVMALPVSLAAADSTRAGVSDAVARLSDPSRKTAVGAAKDLAGMHSEEATRALIGYLRTTKDDYMKIQVLDMIAVDPSTSTARALVQAARDRNPAVRKAALKSLGFRPDAESLPELKRVLSQDSDTGVRKFALQGLSHHTSTAAVEAADSVLSDTKSNRELRVMAAHSLRTINTKEAVKRLEKYTNDSDPAVKNEINRVQGANQVKQKKGT
jgi:HEAT repeat protein